MKGKIEGWGYLEIDRRGANQIILCPLISSDNDYEDEENGLKRCGDWCALFGEPKNIPMMGDNYTELELCKKTLRFDEFTDDRAEIGEKE